MELRHLQTFSVVAEVSGFTRAAEILGYAQSSVTSQIQALEKELGVLLFERLGKKVLLTDAGKQLLPYAKEMIALQGSIKGLIHSEDRPAGTLTIGAPESLAVYRLPSVIQEYRSLFPQVKLILKPGVCWDLRRQAKDGEIDLVFLLEPESQSLDLAFETLVVEPMLLIASVDHQLAEITNLRTDDLKNETILYTEPGCSYRSQFELRLHQDGVFPLNKMEFWNVEAIKNCVMSGLGISFLPLISVEKELKENKLAKLDWDTASIRVATQVAYHKQKWISPSLREFLRIVRKHAQMWRGAVLP